jgi:hypothetical protein
MVGFCQVFGFYVIIVFFWRHILSLSPMNKTLLPPQLPVCPCHPNPCCKWRVKVGPTQCSGRRGKGSSGSARPNSAVLTTRFMKWNFCLFGNILLFTEKWQRLLTEFPTRFPLMQTSYINHCGTLIKMKESALAYSFGYTADIFWLLLLSSWVSFSIPGFCLGFHVVCSTALFYGRIWAVWYCTMM